MLDKKKGAADLAVSGPQKFPAASYSPTGASCSTLGDGALHFRVRNGNGCCLPSMATGKNRPRANPGKQTVHSLGIKSLRHSTATATTVRTFK